MTRILVVTNMYPPHHHGGYELSCHDVVEGLRARGHDVTVLTTRMRVAGVADPPGEEAGGVLRRLDFYWDEHRLISPPLRRRLAIERANQRRLEEALDRSRPDVVSVWNMGAMSLGLLATLHGRDVPVVYAVCSDWLHDGPMLDAWTRLFDHRPRIAAVVERVAGVPTRLPDLGARGTFLFVSQAVREHAEHRSRWRFPDSTIVYSGIDRRDFRAVDPPSVGLRPWRWRLLFVGRLDPRKGVDTAVRALVCLPADATLEVLGTGDPREEERLRALIDELGVGERVSFGTVPRHELRARYADADVVVFPSRWDEPFGLVPVEAMACGIPVVATGTGGSGEFLVDGANALLVPPDAPEALASAVRRLADDPVLRRRLAVAGLATADELTVDRLAEVMEQWHVAAAERFRHGRPRDREAPVVAAAPSD
jgi:glycosyltransferase involved in cell wall biosynthesis